MADEATRSAVVIGHDCWINSHVTLVSGITIGDGAVVLTGAVVTKDVPPYALVVGNPSRQVGWVSAYGHRLTFDASGFARCPESGQLYHLQDGIVEEVIE